MRAAPTLHTDARLQILDLLRGLAALYVVLHHARWLLTTATTSAFDSAGERGLSMVLVPLVGLFRFGHEAVLLFFVISGFCIHYQQARSLSDRQRTGASSPAFSVGRFVFKRARRLYPPLIAALVLTALLDTLGAWLNSAYYAGQSGYQPIDYYLFSSSGRDLVTLIGNLAFQDHLLVGHYGTNVALWSLAYEFWYYALYPLLLRITDRRGPYVMLGVAVAVSVLAQVAYLSAVSPVSGALQVLSLWAIWVAGAFLAEAFVGRVHLAVPRWAAALALAVVVGLAANVVRPVVPLAPPVADLLWGASFAVLVGRLLAPALGRSQRLVAFISARLTALGDISYSLYVAHMPVLALVSASWLAGRAELPRGVELALVGAGLAVAAGVALWYFVERHFVSSHRPSDAPSARIMSGAVAG